MSVKIRLRNAVAELLFLAGLTSPRNRNRGRFAIVTFHRVLPERERQTYPYPGLVVTPDELDSFLAYFSEYFDCGSLATQHARYQGGESTRRPLLAITFDDGQFDNYQFARPVLAKHRLQASFFVPVVAMEQKSLLWHDRLGFAMLALLQRGPEGRARALHILADAGVVGDNNVRLVEDAVIASKGLGLEARLSLVEAMDRAAGTEAPGFARLMTFEELNALAADGHEVGSHSMTHCMMPECDDRALAYELEESRRILQTRTGRPIESFCYPNGNADARTAAAVAKAGYSRAVTTRWGNNQPDTDRFLLNRCDLDAARTRDSSGQLMPALVAFRMSGFYPGLG